MKSAKDDSYPSCIGAVIEEGIVDGKVSFWIRFPNGSRSRRCWSDRGDPQDHINREQERAIRRIDSDLAMAETMVQCATSDLEREQAVLRLNRARESVKNANGRLSGL